MAFITNEGATIYWDEAGSGPPILFIMGLSFTHEMWFRVLPSLIPNFRCIVFDNRGMGRSSVAPGPYSIALMARDAIAVLDAAGVRAAHVVGASMGGMIAQELTLRYPDRVLSLALGCTSHSGVLGRWPHFRFGPRNLNWARAGRFERERALRPLLYASSTPLELIEEDLEVRCRCRWSNKGFWNQFIAILRWTAYRRLPSIRVPTLVLHGAEDHLVPPENGQAIAARIPNARFHLLPEAGHILTTDRPEIAIGLVTEFLREQNQGAPETEP